MSTPTDQQSPLAPTMSFEDFALDYCKASNYWDEEFLEEVNAEGRCLPNKETVKEILLLQMDGIFAQGYGITPRLVMRFQAISHTAKGLYAYLCSCTGSGRHCFPSVQTIRTDMGYSKKLFYKLRKELIAFGLIEVEVKPTASGNGQKTVYTLPTNPMVKPEAFAIVAARKNSANNRAKNFSANKKEQDNVENPYVDNSGEFSTSDKTPDRQPCPQVGDMPLPCPQVGDIPRPQVGDSNIIININEEDISSSLMKDNLTCKKEGLSTPVAFNATTNPTDTQQLLNEDEEKRLRTSFEKLKNRSLKAVPDFDVETTFQAYLDAIKRGFSAVEIAQAYERYMSDYQRNNPTTTRFAKQLKIWLTHGGGLAFYAQNGNSEDARHAAYTSDISQRSHNLSKAKVPVDPAKMSLSELMVRTPRNEAFDRLYDRYSQLTYEAEVLLLRPAEEIEAEKQDLMRQMREIKIEQMRAIQLE